MGHTVLEYLILVGLVQFGNLLVKHLFSQDGNIVDVKVVQRCIENGKF